MNITGPIRHILVAHDLEATSEAALKYAIRLARQLDARITLFYVYELPTLGAPEVLVIATDWTEQFDREARTKLQEVADRARMDSGILIDAEVRAGSPWRAIDAFAKEREMDLVVTGSHGRHGLPRALLGSVAERVVSTAPCPVLVVRADASATATS